MSFRIGYFYIVVPMIPYKGNLEEQKLIWSHGFGEFQPIMTERAWWSNIVHGCGSSVRDRSHHSRPWHRERQALVADYNFQPNDPLFSDKPHLLRVPRSPKIAPLSREQGCENTGLYLSGEHFGFKPYISYNHSPPPTSHFPKRSHCRQPILADAIMGTWVDGVLILCPGCGLTEQALQGCTGGLGKLSVTQPHGMSFPLTPPPPTLLPMWVLIRQLPGALLPIKLLVSLSKKWSLQN